MLLGMADRRLGLAARLARVFPDRRDPTRIIHSLADMFRARMFALCCGYESQARSGAPALTFPLIHRLGRALSEQSLKCFVCYFWDPRNFFGAAVERASTGKKVTSIIDLDQQKAGLDPSKKPAGTGRYK
jgi:hypothetical protein